MTIIWNGKPVSCRKLETGCGRFKPGDFLLWRGEFVRIATVQRECYAIENMHQFTQVTLVSRDGQVIPERALGVREIFRPVR